MDKLKCDRHKVQFNDENNYNEHMTKCARMIILPKQCRLLRNNGKMCARYFNNAYALVGHTMNEHNLYLCGDCHFTGDTNEDLDTHECITDQKTGNKTEKDNLNKKTIKNDNLQALLTKTSVVNNAGWFSQAHI